VLESSGQQLDAFTRGFMEPKTAVQPDGKLASQQTGEVFVDCGAAPFDSKADRTLISPIPFPATLFRSPI
jgi:hypothetical protein